MRYIVKIPETTLRMRRLLLTFLLSLSPALLCAQGAVTEELSRPRGTNPEGPFAALARRDSVVLMARQQIGTRYRYGGTQPERGFDCSGLVRYVLGFIGLELPHNADRQAKLGTEVPVEVDQLQPGDILTFGRGKRITHVGIYVGEGRMVHASTSQRRVIETAVPARGSQNLPLRGVRRVLTPASAPATTPVAPIG